EKRVYGGHMSLFYHAEVGIRDFHVTGVQTCALPIWRGRGTIWATSPRPLAPGASARVTGSFRSTAGTASGARCTSPRTYRISGRSEERRVGEECTGVRQRPEAVHINVRLDKERARSM